jgi:hypothetical protein
LFSRIHEKRKVSAFVWKRFARQALGVEHKSSTDCLHRYNFELLLIRLTIIIGQLHFTGAGTTGKQEHITQAVFNHTEDFVLYPDEVTTSLCAWNSRNASRLHLTSLGHNGPVRHIVHSPTAPAFLTCSDDFRARFWVRRSTGNQY